MKTDRQKLNMHSYISIGMVLLGFAVMCLSEMDNLEILLIIGLLIMAASVWYSIKTQRCPHCDASLMGIRFIPEFCPHCGKKIE